MTERKPTGPTSPRFGRVHPTPIQPGDDEKAGIERLHARRDELVNMDGDAWTDGLIEEAGAIEPRLAEIEDAIETRAIFRPEDIAISGCIVTVGNDGRLQVVHGLVAGRARPSAREVGHGATLDAQGSPHALTTAPRGSPVGSAFAELARDVAVDFLTVANGTSRPAGRDYSVSSGRGRTVPMTIPPRSITRLP